MDRKTYSTAKKLMKEIYSTQQWIKFYKSTLESEYFKYDDKDKIRIQISTSEQKLIDLKAEFEAL